MKKVSCVAALCAGLALPLPPLGAWAQGNANYCSFLVKLQDCNGCVRDRPVVVHPGSVCVFVSSTPGRFLGVEFVLKPSKGRLAVSNFSSVAYQAPATAGEDEFEYRIITEAAGVRQTINIHSHVSIDPNAR